MKLRNKKGEFTKRSRLTRIELKRHQEHLRTVRNNSLLAAFILGFFFACIFAPVVYEYFHPKKESKIIEKVKVEAVNITPTPTPKWNDAIREVFPSDEAGKMIRICLAENGKPYKWDRVYNTNGSYDFGPCQLNSCHKPNNMTFDEWDEYLMNTTNYAKEVRKVYLSQGWNAWVVYNKGLVR